MPIYAPCLYFSHRRCTLTSELQWIRNLFTHSVNSMDISSSQMCNKMCFLMVLTWQISFEPKKALAWCSDSMSCILQARKVLLFIFFLHILPIDLWFGMINSPDGGLNLTLIDRLIPSVCRSKRGNDCKFIQSKQLLGFECAEQTFIHRIIFKEPFVWINCRIKLWMKFKRFSLETLHITIMFSSQVVRFHSFYYCIIITVCKHYFCPSCCTNGRWTCVSLFSGVR